jgi:hypothetical protein
MDDTAENFVVVRPGNAAWFRDHMLDAVETLVVEPERMRL